MEPQYIPATVQTPLRLSLFLHCKLRKALRQSAQERMLRAMSDASVYAILLSERDFPAAQGLIQDYRGLTSAVPNQPEPQETQHLQTLAIPFSDPADLTGIARQIMDEDRDFMVWIGKMEGHVKVVGRWMSVARRLLAAPRFDWPSGPLNDAETQRTVTLNGRSAPAFL
jgi:hypothetical protein